MALDKEDCEETRLMQCPFCGHRAESRGIGAVYCGPHPGGHGISPSRRMYEVKTAEAA